MSSGQREGSLRSMPTMLGLLGIIVAVSGLVWDEPIWLGLVGVALAGLYLFGTPVLTVVFGQISLIAVDTTSLIPFALVEGGLFLVLLSAAIEVPDSRITVSLVALVVPLLGGLAWLSLEQWNLELFPVGAAFLGGAVIVGYLLHRYLLIELDIVTEDPASDSDFQ